MRRLSRGPASPEEKCGCGLESLHTSPPAKSRAETSRAGLAPIDADPYGAIQRIAADVARNFRVPRTVGHAREGER